MRLGELKRIAHVSRSIPLEMTEICDRVLRAGGPAILFEKPKGHTMPRCSPTCSARRAGWRWAWARSRCSLREVGKLLAYLKEPEPPKGLKDAWDKLPVLKQVLNMAPKERCSSAPCQEVVWEGKDVDLARCRSSTAGRATWRR
jgi:4-hydroxy-3-polyprenylbenzoate decarboxylase